MTAIRRDHSHPDRSATRQAPRRWDLASIVDLDQASEAADTVLLVLKEACYNKRDIEGMRIALDEAGGFPRPRSWRFVRESTNLLLTWRSNFKGPTFACNRSILSTAAGQAEKSLNKVRRRYDLI
jgi:hypothetical protein